MKHNSEKTIDKSIKRSLLFMILQKYYEELAFSTIDKYLWYRTKSTVIKNVILKSNENKKYLC